MTRTLRPLTSRPSAKRGDGRGRGYDVYIEPLGQDHSPQGINDRLEMLIRKYPTQYLWNYQRFKKPNK